MLNIELVQFATDRLQQRYSLSDSETADNRDNIQRRLDLTQFWLHSIGLEDIPQSPQELGTLPHVDTVIFPSQKIETVLQDQVEIELNGAPNAGKSTLAANLTSRHPTEIGLVPERIEKIANSFREEGKNVDKTSIEFEARKTMVYGIDRIIRYRYGTSESTTLLDRDLIDIYPFVYAHVLAGNIGILPISSHSMSNKALHKFGIVTGICLPETSLNRLDPGDRPGSIVNDYFLPLLLSQYLAVYSFLLHNPPPFPFALLNLNGNDWSDNQRKFDSAIHEIKEYYRSPLIF